MENEIKALTEELKALKAKETETTRRLAELRAQNAEKFAIENSKLSKSKSFISAQSARVSAETSYAFKNHIAKCIIEEAKEGRTELHYGTYGVCDSQINSVITELTDLGYNINFNSQEFDLVIKW